MTESRENCDDDCRCNCHLACGNSDNDKYSYCGCKACNCSGKIKLWHDLLRCPDCGDIAITIKTITTGELQKTDKRPYTQRYVEIMAFCWNDQCDCANEDFYIRIGESGESIFVGIFDTSVEDHGQEDEWLEGMEIRD